MFKFIKNFPFFNGLFLFKSPFGKAIIDWVEDFFWKTITHCCAIVDNVSVDSQALSGLRRTINWQEDRNKSMRLLHLFILFFVNSHFQKRTI